MVRSPLTLAALATAAVAGLDVVSARSFGSGVQADYGSALLTIGDGSHLIIRVPTSERAEAEQSADLVALRALSTGVRARLPFTVTNFVGQTPIGGTRAVVCDFVYGTPLDLSRIHDGSELAPSLGRAIAAIHTLPTSFVADAGLPVLTSTEILRSIVTIMDRASSTNLVPAALLGRWEKATEDGPLWQFAPTVINGALSADSVLTAEEAVTGIVGWQSLSVGDPARDLFWLLAAAGEYFAEATFDAYTGARDSSDRQVKHRAMLYAELEIAKWLLHGTQERSTEIVDDAVQMLNVLVDTVQNDLNQNLGHTTMPVLAVGDVTAMLDRDRPI